MFGSMRVHWVGGVMLVFGLSLAVGQDPKPKPDAEELKKKYPFVSVADRLAYEVEKSAAATAPKLTTESAKRLEFVERYLGSRMANDTRIQSLALLHKTEVKKFTDREGFGVERTRAPRIDLVVLPPAPVIPFPSEAGRPLAEADVGAPAALPPTAKARSGGPFLPALDSLADAHRHGMLNFAEPASLGLVQGRDRVAGFESHRFRYMPQLPQPPASATKDKEAWLIARLELVSLLKHEKPAVYVSENLPRMEDLKKARTRPLTAFEEKALESLRAGEDVVTEATTNRIHMMGAMRAASQCLECHHGQRGDLLGTFSYELRRDPPAKAEK